MKVQSTKQEHAEQEHAESMTLAESISRYIHACSRSFSVTQCLDSTGAKVVFNAAVGVGTCTALLFPTQGLPAPRFEDAFAKHHYDWIAPLEFDTPVYNPDEPSPPTFLRAFRPWFEPGEWQGDLVSYQVSTSTGVLSTRVNLSDPSGTPSYGSGPSSTWSAARQMDDIAWDSRIVVTWNGKTQVPFRHGSVPSVPSKDISNTYTRIPDVGPTLSLNSDVIRYIRGDRSNEFPSGNFRARFSLLGDIIHSNPVFISSDKENYNSTQFPNYASYNRPSNRIIVGSNDGMVHIFNASNGEEIWAYVPSGVHKEMMCLVTDGRVTLVDGGITVRDAKVGTGGISGWQTVAVGGLGAGGKGVYALRLKDPASESTRQVIWEVGPNDSDIGMVFGKPNIILMNDGNFYAGFGNGFNSQRGNNYLYLKGLSTGAERKILAGSFFSSGTNPDPAGLSMPSFVDINYDGKVDLAYAGDINGNLWKFDLLSSSPSSWSATKIYSGSSSAPFITKPDIGNHTRYGLMVMAASSKPVDFYANTSYEIPFNFDSECNGKGKGKCKGKGKGKLGDTNIGSPGPIPYTKFECNLPGLVNGAGTEDGVGKVGKGGKAGKVGKCGKTGGKGKTSCGPPPPSPPPSTTYICDIPNQYIIGVWDKLDGSAPGTNFTSRQLRSANSEQHLAVVDSPIDWSVSTPPDGWYIELGTDIKAPIDVRLRSGRLRVPLVRSTMNADNFNTTLTNWDCEFDYMHGDNVGEDVFGQGQQNFSGNLLFPSCLRRDPREMVRSPTKIVSIDPEIDFGYTNALTFSDVAIHPCLADPMICYPNVGNGTGADGKCGKVAPVDKEGKMGKEGKGGKCGTIVFEVFECNAPASYSFPVTYDTGKGKSKGKGKGKGKGSKYGECTGKFGKSSKGKGKTGKGKYEGLDCPPGDIEHRTVPGIHDEDPFPLLTPVPEHRRIFQTDASGLPDDI